MLALLSLLSLLPVALTLPLLGFEHARFLGLGDSTDDNSATDTPTALDLASVNATFLKPALFARVAYCSSASITSWSCGAPCQALKNITFLQSGGDEGAIPLYYIAHDGTDNSLVVAHEGTDPKKLLSILNDAQFGLVALNSSRFPDSVGQNITVHDGFQQTFERTADGLLAGVMSGLASTGATKVFVTGHSLGAALATMTGALIKTNVPSSVPVEITGFGLPRGGNEEWANFLDTIGVNFMSNQNDPVPTVPPKFLGFQHSSGEAHIIDPSTPNIVSCPGQDNENCATGNSLLDISIPNHLGPYFNGLSFGGSQCDD
ncbi:alpha/beta-hydrolase [Roridomyces roridus]|uniref:Alpha/beta-hydrolase n=1 Tax=Roridomyces roridus TaxID=1738132 RepID=A0AAD7CAQ0_9AGAR|nr:alpha/beta-hydrolase [Roridomyces roridus]